ncbi:PREDICTED: F-box/LRR-repeat protein At3g48880-like [Fragaria vesca subsp. vesca]|uniref:F-box/LRR-repeat protein At3g48880-like n=1 Tax=Fragaria vesca subsp. vesca TaxID=101020 RepID=UPI0002C3199B|nr:PREDICTED: F-box/LRR-repeat protein At3g48880-like [Fragaria vesca subsp. vesca]
MDNDILIRIFMTLNVVELVCVASVCKSWREAAFEPCLWEVVDFSKLKATNFNPQREQSSHRVINILSSAFRLCGGTISCLIFHLNTYITSQQLVLVSKRLVLPVQDTERLVNGSEEAAKNWPKLESLTIRGRFTIEFMKAIGQHCNNLIELKMLCLVDMDCAESIIAYAPSLKVSSIEFNMVHRDAMLSLLKEMKQLEELSMSHCLILDHSPIPGYMSVLVQLDELVLQEASRLKKFMFFQSPSHVRSFEISLDGDTFLLMAI